MFVIPVLGRKRQVNSWSSCLASLVYSMISRPGRDSLSKAGWTVPEEWHRGCLLSSTHMLIYVYLHLHAYVHPYTYKHSCAAMHCILVPFPNDEKKKILTEATHWGKGSFHPSVPLHSPWWWGSQSIRHESAGYNHIYSRKQRTAHACCHSTSFLICEV